MSDWSALVPAQRSTAWAAMLSAATQTQPPTELIVLDTAVRPLTSRYEFRMALDIITEKGIRAVYLRARPDGVKAARVILGDAATSDVLGWLDDDAWLEPHAAEACLHCLSRYKFPAISSSCPTPNNEYEDAHWAAPAQAPAPWSYPPPASGPVADHRIGFSGVFLKRSAWPQVRQVLTDPLTPESGEDRATWAALGGIAVAPGAVAWELKHPEGRTFAPYLEAVT